MIKPIRIDDTKILEFSETCYREIYNFSSTNSYMRPIDKLIKICGIINDIGKDYHKSLPKVIEDKIGFKLNLDDEVKTVRSSCSNEEVAEYYSRYYSTDLSDFPEDTTEVENYVSDELMIDINEKYKNNLTIDCYGLSLHLFLHCGEKTISIINKIIEQIMDLNEDIEYNYRHLFLTSIFTKMKARFIGKDKSNLDYFRPLSKLCVLGTVIDRYVYDRVKLHYTSKKSFDKSQYVFNRNGLLKASKKIINKVLTLNENPESFILFLDIKNSYTNVNKPKLIQIMKDDGVNKCFVKYITNFLKYTTGFVNDVNKSFPIEKGLLQGIPSSQVLFVIYMNSYIKKLKNKLKYLDTSVDITVYVDDIVITGAKREHLDLVLIILSRLNKDFCFEFAKEKIRIMTHKNTYSGIFEGTEIKPVELGFKYLGGYIYEDDYELTNYILEELIISKFIFIVDKATCVEHFLALIKKNIMNAMVLKLPKSSLRLFAIDNIHINKINFFFTYIKMFIEENKHLFTDKDGNSFFEIYGEEIIDYLKNETVLRIGSKLENPISLEANEIFMRQLFNAIDKQQLKRD